jgi:rubrerythrin
MEEVAAEFLHLWLDGEIFERMKQDTEIALRSGKAVNIIRTAMQLESDAIVFYTGFLDMVEGDEDRNLVSKIISDERNHFMQLNRQLKKLK